MLYVYAMLRTECETVLGPLYLAGQIRNFAAQQGLGTLQHLEVVRRGAELLLVRPARLDQRRRNDGQQNDDWCWVGWGFLLFVGRRPRSHVNGKKQERDGNKR